ncbi:GNAT family N-acetyltransferase [Solibacillus isronensis]|uniref:GNAT family N-acetyltransferase n=1 Tax=Solibacillus isronensis TaxID=412383 RepID=UPI0009A82260|nr:GNAT family N-acetyltransferase [Solibacillus isronensis]
MVIKIEEAKEQHYIEVNRLVRQGHDDHVRGDNTVFREVESVMPEEYYLELLEQEQSTVLIAREGNKIIGFAVISIEASPDFPSLVQRRFAYIHDFGVDQSEKRKGIGSLLFEACLKWAKEMNVDEVELNVWEFNEEAIAFYKKHSMKTISRKLRLALQ